MFIPVFIAATIAGALIGYVAIPEIQSFFEFKKRYIILIMLLILMVASVFIATSIHRDESARFNSNAERQISLYWCFIESPDQCYAITNALNNASYQEYTDGKIEKSVLFLPISLIDSMWNNFASAFCLGTIISYFVVFRKDFYG